MNDSASIYSNANETKQMHQLSRTIFLLNQAHEPKYQQLQKEKKVPFIYRSPPEVD